MLEHKMEIVVRKEEDRFQVGVLFETQYGSKCESSPVKDRSLMEHISSEIPSSPGLSSKKLAYLSWLFLVSRVTF